MTEEAANLVAKLIEEDVAGTRSSARINNTVPSTPSQGIIGSATGGGASVNSKVALGLDDLAPNQSHLKSNSVGGSAPNVVNQHTPSVDVWLYRDPQGSVQGPFSTHEMAMWYSQVSTDRFKWR